MQNEWSVGYRRQFKKIGVTVCHVMQTLKSLESYWMPRWSRDRAFTSLFVAARLRCTVSPYFHSTF